MVRQNTANLASRSSSPKIEFLLTTNKKINNKLCTHTRRVEGIFHEKQYKSAVTNVAIVASLTAFNMLNARQSRASRVPSILSLKKDHVGERPFISSFNIPLPGNKYVSTKYLSLITEVNPRLHSQRVKLNRS